MKKKIISLLLSATMLIGVLAGCGEPEESTVQSGSSATTAAVSEDGVNLVYGLNGTWSSLQIWNGPTTYSCMVQDVLFEPLAKAGQDSLEYRNASSIDVSEDGTVWTCHLNEDVTWSDGTPTTAEDWVWTFQQMTDPTFGTYETSYVTCILAGTDDSGVLVEGEELGMKALDDYTLEITFKQPTSLDGFFSWYGYYYRALPKHLLEDVAPADLATCDFWEHPIGNGCLLYVDEPVTGQEITFEKREGYYLGDVAFDTLTYRVGSSENATSTLLNGDVDTFYNITDLDSLAEMESAENLQVNTYDSGGEIVEMSINNEKFNANVRRALSLAIDRETMCEALTAGYGVPKMDSVSDSSECPGRDIEEAKRILDEEGWDYNYVITIVCGTSRENQATIIQQNWAEIGVQSTIRTGETAANFADAMNGDVDCCIMANNLSYAATVDSSILDPSSTTYSRIQDSKYYDLCQKIDFETDPEAKQALIDEYTELLRNEAPYIYLYTIPKIIVSSTRVSGIKGGNADNPWEWTINN